MNHRRLKTNSIRLILILVAGSLVHNLHAQLKDIRFRHLSIEQGLSQSYAQCIVQDNRGFMWIGTETGLNKYDGYTFTTYEFDVNNSNSLSNSNVISIGNDSAGILWVGTESGLNRFDREKGTFVRYKNRPDDPSSISDNQVNVIHEDKSGILWSQLQNSFFL